MKFRFAVMISLAVSLVSLAALPVRAQVGTVPVHVFGSASCHLCEEATAYLRAVAERENAVVFWHVAKDNRRETDLMFAVAKELVVDVDGYPFIVVGRRAHVGWRGSTTGLIVTRELAQVRVAGEEDVVTRLENQLTEATESEPPRSSAWLVSLIAAGLLSLVVAVVAALVIAIVITRKRSAL